MLIQERTTPEKSVSAVIGGVFNIKRHLSALWRNQNMNAGFECSIDIAAGSRIRALSLYRPSTIHAEGIGIRSDFRLTPKLYYS